MVATPSRNENYTEWPRRGRCYDVTTNLGNIHRSLTFLGYSNGGVKPKYLFKTKNGKEMSINPSYEVEIEESVVQENNCIVQENIVETPI